MHVTWSYWHSSLKCRSNTHAVIWSGHKSNSFIIRQLSLVHFPSGGDRGSTCALQWRQGLWLSHEARVPAYCQVSRYTTMKAKKLSRIVAILVRSVTSQSCCRSYRYPYTLVCLFCPLRTCNHNQEARNAVVVRKSHQNFWMKRVWLKSWERHKQLTWDV